MNFLSNVTQGERDLTAKFSAVSAVPPALAGKLWPYLGFTFKQVNLVCYVVSWLVPWDCGKQVVGSRPAFAFSH